MADGDGEADIHLAADDDQGVGIEAAVGPHRELSPGPSMAHPAHGLPQEVGGAAGGVGPAEIRPVARAVLVDRLDPVHVAAVRLHVGIRVAGRRRAGVGVYFYELARIVDGAVAPEYLIVGDGAVGGVLPCEGNRIVRRRDDDSRGLIGNGALLRPHRIRAGGGEGQHDDAYGQRSQNGEPDNGVWTYW